MDRNAELLYLRDVRDLELVRNKLKNDIGFSKAQITRFQKDAKRAPNLRKHDKTIKIRILMTLITAVLAIFAYYCGAYWNENLYGIVLPIILTWFVSYKQMDYLDGDDDMFFYIALLVCLCGYSLLIVIMNFFGNHALKPPFIYIVVYIALLIIAGILMPVRKINRFNAKVEEHNKLEQQKKEKDIKDAKAIYSRNTNNIIIYEKELKKVENLLAQAYSLNIIPTQFRYNLSAIWYIYDWMYSSGSSLRDALFSAKIEEGIQRIEAKLGTIISQNENIIINQRQIEANQSSMRKQNEAMLSRLSAVNSNTAAAREYARVASVYSGVSAMFATSVYLNRK